MFDFPSQSRALPSLFGLAPTLPIRSQSAPLSRKFLPLNEKPLKRAFRRCIYCGDENINSRRRSHVKTSSALHGHPLFARRRNHRSRLTVVFIIHFGATIG